MPWDNIVGQFRKLLQERHLHTPVADILVVQLEYGADSICVGMNVVNVRVFERKWPIELIKPPEVVREVACSKVIVITGDKTIAPRRPNEYVRCGANYSSRSTYQTKKSTAMSCCLESWDGLGMS